MILIGDIHGQTSDYLKLLQRFEGQTSVQLGDFGAGFVPLPTFPPDAWFLRGNHDNPEVCRQSKSYLGDYGYTTVGVPFFWVSGAWSIDYRGRIEGKSWWRDEELSAAQMNAAFDLYMKVKPELVLSHDAPGVATAKILKLMPDSWLNDRGPERTRTGQMLSAMFNAWQPKQWVFGHWHTRWSHQEGKTLFTCLPELGWLEIPEEKC